MAPQSMWRRQRTVTAVSSALSPMSPMSPASPVSPGMPRRGFLALTAGVGGMLALAACGDGGGDGGTASGADELSVLYFEGAGQDVVPKKVLEAFRQKHSGLKIKPIIGGSRYPEVISAYKASGTALVNTGLFTAQAMALGSGIDMFRPLSGSEVSRAGSADQTYRHFGDTGVPFNTNVVGLVHRTDLADPPTSWLDLLNPVYRGKVGLYDAPQGILIGGLWAVNQALGGDPETLDEGFKAFAEAAKAGQFSTVYNSNQTQYDAFSRGKAVIGVSILAAQANWAAQGAKIGYVAPKEGQMAIPLYLAVVKGGSPDQEKLAIELVNDLLKPENVGEYNQNTFAGSVYGDVAPAKEQAAISALSAEAMAKVLQVDWKRFAAMEQKLVERWNRDVKGNLR
ncbi:extracellular solute-binding protein [Streptosporangium sp. NPDC051022]|uniref:extracellular solute-binding protein n=1 Tax=Streptosporangium sp. NPDC051022 TaxID=3155752 RepID=UPI00342A2D42